MSLWGTFVRTTFAINAATVGLVYRTLSGNVDPWTYNIQKYDAVVALKQAAGPNADPVALQNNINTTLQQMDTIYRNQPGGSALPGDCYFRVPFFGCVVGPDSGPGLKKVDFYVNLLLGIVLVLIAYWALKKSGILGDLVKVFK
jgi:hypothetical protein